MYSTSDYRSMARRALKNYWWLAVGVTLLASLLGGTSSSFTHHSASRSTGTT